VNARQIKSLLVSSAILVLCSGALPEITADPTAIVTIADRSAAPGRTTMVKLSVTGVPEPGLSDLQGSLSYDPKVLHVERVVGLNDYQVFAYNADNDLGRVRFVVAKVSGRFLREGNIIQFQVKAVGQVGDSSLLELELEAFNDPDGNPIAHRIEDGGFIIKAQQAIFTFLPAEPRVNETVQFIDQSVGNIVRWLWDFGDGEGSTEQNPSHKYTASGTYTVQLLVEDRTGATDITSEEITVRPLNQPPQADFSFSPASPGVDETVQFTDKSKDPDGTIQSWAWEFGDGSSSSAQNPTHKYSQARTYTVKLTVTDNEGASHSISKQITVGGGGQPRADFSFTPANPRPGQNVQFLDNSSDPDGKIVKWSWDFGDGGTSSVQSPSHKYSKAGTYMVKLTVTDNDGLSATATKQITVGAAKPTVTVHCFPNPASTQTTFKYTLPSGTAKATIYLFDLVGKPVFHHDLSVTGSEYNWNLRSDGGADLPNGPYFYYIIAYNAQGKILARSTIGKLLIQRS
jgi:PKD repeat protein